MIGASPDEIRCLSRRSATGWTMPPGQLISPGCGTTEERLMSCRTNPLSRPALLVVVKQEDDACSEPAVGASVLALDELDPLPVVQGNAAQALDDSLDDRFFVRQIG